MYQHAYQSNSTCEEDNISLQLDFQKFAITSLKLSIDYPNVMLARYS